jgi:hypothetical protein
MNTQQGNGGAASPRVPRVKVSFRLHVPEFVTLEFDPPREAKPGQWGDQFMYFLAENRIAFVEPVVHEKLVALGARAGESFAITKEPKGAWEVKRPHAASVEAPAQVSAPRTAPPPIRAGNEAASTTGNVMAHALKQAMEACQLAEFHEASREDIRALAITIYITTTGGRK